MISNMHIANLITVCLPMINNRYNYIWYKF